MNQPSKIAILGTMAEETVAFMTLFIVSLLIPSSRHLAAAFFAQTRNSESISTFYADMIPNF